MANFRCAQGYALVRHGKRQRCLAHKGHSITQIGRHPSGGFTALFSANAADNQLVDVTFTQPAVKPGIREGIMDVFLENHIRLMTQKGHRFDIAALQREGAIFIHVKNINDRNTARLAAFNQPQHRLLKGRNVALLPVRAMMEGLLSINIDECNA